MSLSIASSPATDFSQLPFLLRLIDDPSPAVREKVGVRLREWGIRVWPEIERRELLLTDSQRSALQSILSPPVSFNQQAPDSFLEWLRLPTENERLEAAYGWLSRLNWGASIGAGLHEALDELAREYLEYSGSPDSEELSNFLFRHKGLYGADSQDFYDPQNSDLLSVIENGRGIPISLTSIFILVGARLDLTIVGCNFPGHFLARAPFAGPPTNGVSFLHHGYGADLVFDCYNGGRVLSVDEVASLRKTSSMELRNPASAVIIMNRVLYNLATAHHILGDRDRTVYFLNLRKQLEEAAKKMPFE